MLSNNSQKFYALHKARAESLCARGAGYVCGLPQTNIPHDNNRNRLPVKVISGCLLRSNFTGKKLFWSSSPYAPNSNNAWNVNFNNGNDNVNNKSNNNHVRLVRSGEWYGASY